MSRGTPFDEVERLLERLDDARDGGLAVDVEDAGDAFAVRTDLPGFEKTNIDVEVQDRTVRVDAEHEADDGDADADYVIRERTKQSASRSVTLPEAIEENEASATFADGVLTVTLPKTNAGGDATSVDVE
ncbi:Hsp20/alpha crystallin family protein [Halobacterium litoreum]|uniref:Hsp20/alpha crystallin family protein n=1 Tax=Halobacterium litoreum TaxID=2039234 RepID=A0ABD5NFS0_9EURY|nr:Hsp20/alpha crystallin family protein [Halobacterium litoreum]UHH13150.1 Hsp20/alpha crystallin family protein [Halobacterium litoreum]